MTSGIAVSDEIPGLFNDMKLRHTQKWITFKIENKKEIVVGECGAACDTSSREEDEQAYDAMKASLKLDEPRYILYDFKFQMKDNRTLEKLAFIFYCPDNCKIGLKMIYASSKDAIKKLFTGLGGEFQANESSELDYKEMADELERKA